MKFNIKMNYCRYLKMQIQKTQDIRYSHEINELGKNRRAANFLASLQNLYDFRKWSLFYSKNTKSLTEILGIWWCFKFYNPHKVFYQCNNVFLFLDIASSKMYSEGYTVWTKSKMDIQHIPFSKKTTSISKLH